MVSRDESHTPLTSRRISLRSKPGRKIASLARFSAPFKSRYQAKMEEGVNPSSILVRMGGFEPPSFRRRILSPLCMPFHHIRLISIWYYSGLLFASQANCFDTCRGPSRHFKSSRKRKLYAIRFIHPDFSFSRRAVL